MRPRDIVMALTAAVAFGVLAGALLAESVRTPEPTARIYRAPECRPPMQLPLDWTIVVIQSGDGKAPVTRFYSAPSKR